MRVTIEIAATGDAASSFKNAERAMCVTLSDTETLQLGKDILLVHQGVEVLTASLNAFVAGREAQGKSDPEMRDARVDIADHLSECANWQSRVREKIGRAVFVSVIAKSDEGGTE